MKCSDSYVAGTRIHRHTPSCTALGRQACRPRLGLAFHQQARLQRPRQLLLLLQLELQLQARHALRWYYSHLSQQAVLLLLFLVRVACPARLAQDPCLPAAA